MSARTPVPWHAEAQRLYAELGSYSEVGRRLDKSTPSVWSALNRERERDRQRQRSAANPGYATEQKRRWRQDPANAEKDRAISRRWKEENRERNRARDIARLDAKATGRCSCGNRISDGADECGRCAATAAANVRRERIVHLWHAGWSLAAIAVDLGSTVNSIGVDMQRMRAAGYDLPYRYTTGRRAGRKFPEQVAA